MYISENGEFLNHIYNYKQMDALYLFNRIMAEIIKTSPRMSAVIKKYRGFDYKDCKSLTKEEDDQLKNYITRYRKTFRG